MAKFVSNDYKITINGTDFSQSLAQVNLEISSDDVETTAFGGTFRTRIGGLKDGTLQLDFMQDFAAASVDATLFPLLNSLDCRHDSDVGHRVGHKSFLYGALSCKSVHPVCVKRGRSGDGVRVVADIRDRHSRHRLTGGITCDDQANPVEGGVRG